MSISSLDLLKHTLFTFAGYYYAGKTYNGKNIRGLFSCQQHIGTVSGSLDKKRRKKMPPLAE
jgi:hypothetical protein